MAELATLHGDGCQCQTFLIRKCCADPQHSFIIEGAITVGIALIFFFALPTFPEQSKWLKDDEKAYVAARLRLDQGKSGVERPIRVKDVVQVFKDPKVFIAGVSYFGLIVPAYCYSYFAPSMSSPSLVEVWKRTDNRFLAIIKGYGYSALQTQLHSVPPWAAAFAFSMFIATMSDYARHRFAFIMFSILVSITGFAMLLGVHSNTSVQYGKFA
jgi:hypothetical protein